MIRRLEGERPAFVLDTEHTTYMFSIAPFGQPEHLYYGKKIRVKSWEECDVLREKREFELGNSIVYAREYPTVLPEDMCLEMSAPGHGDIREPFLELVLPDGSRSTDFHFMGYEIDRKDSDFATLPSSYAGKGKAEHLLVRLKDGELVLELHYRVYSDSDVITRCARITNGGEETVFLERLMSSQLDLPESGMCVTSFHGAWAREMDRHTVTLTAGKYVIESNTGGSSSRANPFFMVHDPMATERNGAVYGFNLIYSGNHYSAVEVNAYGKTRIVSGIQPRGFCFVLAPGETFEAPEAVMTFSDKGFSGQSVNMHRFVRNHIVRGTWKHKPRPVLQNSWEACYFKIDAQSLLALAQTGKKLGVELFVVDDGWFGERDDDTRSLGDWVPDQSKLPGGLKPLCNQINDMGLLFGIWVEPEMVNVNSRLYRRRPEWTMEVPGRLHSEGRNQRILDLANPEVQDFLIKRMTRVFSSANISYVKWDMNRIFSDVFSPSLPSDKQGETAHRYICGLYRVMRELTKQFPDILFEGCASGGNRFDLGMLCYFPQIWGSDNTDAVCRAAIQEGYSYGYPQSCIGAHVSAVPNHQTLRSTPLQTRYAVSSFGLLGYELDVRDLDGKQKRMIRQQIKLYQQWRDVLQFGQFYRITTGNVHQWICVSKDKTKAVGMVLQELTVPNTQYLCFRAAGLDPKKTYRFYSVAEPLDVKQFGSLINTVSPVHVRQDSVLHNVIAKAVKISGEQENVTVSGSLLMHAGIALKPAFSGTGFNENVRVFPDFASRIYFMEEVK